MMLVDEGKVSLDDPVTKFIPLLNKWMVVEEKDDSHVLLRNGLGITSRFA
jgi:CubicO group peptidase (beta-lactamase class C family)